MKAYCCSHRRGTRGTQRDNNERAREVERKREREKKTEERGQFSLVLPDDGQILQNILLTIFTKIPGLRTDLCQKFSANLPCASS